MVMKKFSILDIALAVNITIFLHAIVFMIFMIRQAYREDRPIERELGKFDQERKKWWKKMKKEREEWEAIEAERKEWEVKRKEEREEWEAERKKWEKKMKEEREDFSLERREWIHLVQRSWMHTDTFRNDCWRKAREDRKELREEWKVLRKEWENIHLPE